jgi:predicted oxidoreductase
MVQIYGADDLEHSMSRVVKVRPKTMVLRAACGIATQSSDGNGCTGLYDFGFGGNFFH